MTLRTLSVIIAVLTLSACAGNYPSRSISDAFSAPAGLTRNACVFYFDYKSDIVRDDNRPQVEEWAAKLRDNPTQYIELEGKTDRIGSEAYNLELGLRRAANIKLALVAAGALKTQITVITSGESRPVVEGNSEIAHAANRCVDVYENIPHRPDAVRGSKQP